MLLISTYQDLLIEIDVYESRLEDLQREDYALRRIEYNRIDLETYVNRKHKLNNEAAIIQAILEDKKETQKAILEKLSKLEGLEYKIAYKRFVEGKTLNEIAEELGYSYQYMKEISSRNKTYYKPTEDEKQKC
jgi:DNA-directed RNA polymerase specialized sigma subunit